LAVGDRAGQTSVLDRMMDQRVSPSDCRADPLGQIAGQVHPAKLGQQRAGAQALEARDRLRRQLALALKVQAQQFEQQRVLKRRGAPDNPPDRR
jgi:hypothetical protein